MNRHGWLLLPALMLVGGCASAPTGTAKAAQPTPVVAGPSLPELTDQDHQVFLHRLLPLHPEGGKATEDPSEQAYVSACGDIHVTDPVMHAGLRVTYTDGTEDQRDAYRFPDAAQPALDKVRELDPSCADLVIGGEHFTTVALHGTVLFTEQTKAYVTCRHVTGGPRERYRCTAYAAKGHVLVVESTTANTQDDAQQGLTDQLENIAIMSGIPYYWT